MHILVRVFIALLLVISVLAFTLHLWARHEREQEEQALSTLRKDVLLSSRSFPPNGDMPVDCSCNGRGISPALTWESSLTAVKSFVILATDYDVPSSAYPLLNLSHWVVYNLPASVRSLPEGVTAEQLQLLGGKVGKNSKRNTSYMGPCPPLGQHAYVFRVYALNQLLGFADLPDKAAILAAMQGHILGYGELTGYFQ